MALTNTQYDYIMRGYELRQRTRRLLIEERQQKLYDKSPPLRSADQQSSSVAGRRGKLFLDGDTDAATPKGRDCAAKPRKSLPDTGLGLSCRLFNPPL